MSEPTPQDRRQTAAAQTSTPKYTTLKETALSFIAAQSHAPSAPSGMDFASLRRLVTRQYTHTFGPAYAVSQNPKLQGAFTIDAFIEHLSGMLPFLATWDIDVKSVVVDEVGECVVVRAGYGMCVKGTQERVENEVVWWLELEEGEWGSEAGEGDGIGRGWKVGRSMEVVDPAAAGRIRELIVAGMRVSGGKKDLSTIGDEEDSRA